MKDRKIWLVFALVTALVIGAASVALSIQTIESDPPEILDGLMKMLYGSYGRPDIRDGPVISDEEKVRLDNLARELAQEYEPDWMSVITNDDRKRIAELSDIIRKINGEATKRKQLNNESYAGYRYTQEETVQRTAAVEELDALVPKGPDTYIDPDVRKKMEAAQQRLLESNIPWVELGISTSTGKLSVYIDIYAAQDIDDEIRQITGDIPLDIRYVVHTAQLQSGCDINGGCNIVNDADCSGNASCLKGRITRIVDGDTIDVEGTRVRLALTSTPELDLLEGIKAKKFVEEVCPVGSHALVDEDDGQTEGSYGRMIGKVFCQDTLLNEKILEEGFGEINTYYCTQSEFQDEPWAKKYGC